MQLRRKARIAKALGLFTAELLTATAARAQIEPSAPSPASINEDTDSDYGLTRVDSAVLFYQEAGGRVRATEPVVGMTVNRQSGAILSLKLTSDTLTGATPNGTTPWREEQHYVKDDTNTGASGVLVAAPGALPLNTGFKDQRYAADAGLSFLADLDTRLSVGGGYSKETDYRSVYGNLGVARTFNDKNTTVSLGGNYEHDRSDPKGGTPSPLKAIDGIDRNGGPETKRVISVVGGITQVMRRNWLIQLNYSFGNSTGYQTDPYRMMSVIDRRTGGPVQYIYEGRPGKRTRHALYLGSKVSLGSQVLDLSARAYKDSWGVRSITLQASDRIPMAGRLFAEPSVRFYRQSAADFFRYYLLSTEPLPAFASPDVRLGRFTGLTLGTKLGLRIGRASEVYVRGDWYRQTGRARPRDAPGYLADQTLFSGVKAWNIMAGYSFAFD